MVNGPRGLKPEYAAEFEGESATFPTAKAARMWMRRRRKERIMKKSEVKVGHVYIAKVSDRLVPVRIDSVHSRQGWNATNTKTGRRVHIKSAQRLRREAKNATKVEDRNDRDRDRAPRSELTLEEADKLEKVRTAKAKKAKATEGQAKPKRTSALDAAAIVLKDVGRPLNCKELIEMMAARELWQSPNGKTPEATLYAAILRELKTKGDAARFRKVGRGQFVYAG